MDALLNNRRHSATPIIRLIGEEKMNKKFLNIYTKENGYIVFAALLHDKGTKKQEISILIQDPQGALSEPIPVKKSNLLGKNTFNFFKDYEGDFDDDDILKVSYEIQKYYGSNTLPLISNSTKLSQKEVHIELCNYVHKHENTNNISIVNGYCNIPTKIFNSVVNELDMGYTAIEVKKMLKVVLDVLRTNSNRPYGYAMTDEEGEQYRVVSFKDVLATATQIYGGGTDVN